MQTDDFTGAPWRLTRTSGCDPTRTSFYTCGGFVLTHEGSSVVAGPCLHGATAVWVAGGKRLGNGGCGLAASIACPTQNELQCGSLRKRFKWRQSLRERQMTNGRSYDEVKKIKASKGNPLPFRQEWFPTWPASYWQGCLPSPASPLHTLHPAAATSCRKQWFFFLGSVTNIVLDFENHIPS